MAVDETRTRAFSLRLPEDLYLALKNSTAVEGASMNQVVGLAVARFLDEPQLAPSDRGLGVRPEWVPDAVGLTAASIGPTKGIAKHLVDVGQPALACVVYAAAARLVIAEDGGTAGSREFGRAGALAERHRLRDVAEALFRSAVVADPQNLEARGRLGQLLHHRAQRENDSIELYAEAEDLLRPVAPLDDRARLFHGWAAYFVAREEGREDWEATAIAQIADSLRAWAFGSYDEGEHQRWVRQIDRLSATGPIGRAHASDLLEFAKAHAKWTTPGSPE